MKNKPYKSKTQNEISYFVNARQKTYKHSTEIYLPNNPYEKLEEGYEQSNKATSAGAPIPTSEDEKLERSKRRTYNAVKDLALCNNFELFATFTFRDNRFNDEVSRNKMIGWLKRQRKLDKSFQYLIISELHKKCEECVQLRAKICDHDDRPKALHYHALIGGYGGDIVRAINPKTSKPLVKGWRKVYDFPNFTLGNSEVYFIGDTEEDRIRSSFYLLKYVKKDMTTFKGRKRYWASRGLSKPLTIENPEEWYLAVTPDHLIESEYGKFLFFNNKRIEIFLPWN